MLMSHLYATGKTVETRKYVLTTSEEKAALVFGVSILDVEHHWRCRCLVEKVLRYDRVENM